MIQDIIPEFVWSDWMEVLQSPINVTMYEAAASKMHVSSVTAGGDYLGV